MNRAMGGHQSATMGTDQWLTPPTIIQALGPFDLDPCAAPEPRPWSTAKRHITWPEDGLHEPWEGRVWLNPPYGKWAARWLKKLTEHGSGTALIFARTETRMFFELVWGQADALLFLRGRLHFHHPNGEVATDNAGAPSVLVAYGREDVERLAGCDLDGFYIALAHDRVMECGDYPEKDRQDIVLRWQHDKSIGMWVDGKYATHFWDPESVVADLDEWDEQYLCGDADGWPSVTEDCTDAGLETLAPWEYQKKWRQLAESRLSAIEAAREDKHDADREERR